MNKKIAILGGGHIGGTTLTGFPQSDVIVVKANEKEGMTINEHLERDRGLKITNTHSHVLDYDTKNINFKIYTNYHKRKTRN